MGKTRLGMAFEEVSGSYGDNVVARSRSGLATRAKPTYKYPKNAAVQAGNARLAAANRLWNAMSVEEAEDWNRYAESLPLKRGFDGTRYRTTGKNVLVAYVAKILQIDPEATLPVHPPRDPFDWPLARVALSTAPGSLVFTTDRVVPADVKVEIMVQALVNGKRKPTRFYKSAAFATFPEEGSTVEITVQAGWVACAVQFVQPSTGRVEGRRVLGKVEVPAS